MTDREFSLKLIKYGVLLICVAVLSYSGLQITVSKGLQCELREPSP